MAKRAELLRSRPKYNRNLKIFMDLTGTLIAIFACAVSALGYFSISKMLDATDQGDGML